MRAQALSQPNNPVAAMYRDHFGYVWQILQKLGVESVALDDAAQDVFVVAHRRWHDFEGRSSARTWLFGIARRVAYRHRRAGFRRRRRRAALSLVPTPATPEPDALLLRKQAWQQLLAFLDELEPEQREAFVLGDVEGCSRTQMGHALRVSPNTAYSRLRAARRRFVRRFPDADARDVVRRASSPPARADEERGWLLLTTAVAVPAGGMVVPAAAVFGLLSVTLAGFALSPEMPASDPKSAAAPSRDAEAAAAPSPRRATETATTAAGGTLAAAVSPAQATSSQQPGPGPSRARRRASLPKASGEVEAPRPEFDPLSPAMVALSRARRALHRDQAEAALEHLAQSERLDVGGVFATERAVTRVWALCAAGRVAQAKAAYRGLQRAGAAGAYVDVLSKSCVGAVVSSAAPGDQGG